MPGKAVGRAAADLPWLCPNTDSLIGLAEPPAGLARPSAADPPCSPSCSASPARRRRDARSAPDRVPLARHCPTPPRAFLAATRRLARPTAEVVGCVSRRRPRGGALARRLAEDTRRVARTRRRGRRALAPLGWFAVAAVDPAPPPTASPTPTCRSDPAGTQADDWGLDQDAIARRLATRGGCRTGSRPSSAT